MCGIACLIDNDGRFTRQQFERFTDAVAHRGPDGRGTVYFAERPEPADEGERFRLALGHRRLSILDLSDAGGQPMFSADRRCAITYNGEVYNYLELRAELERRGHAFRSHCDTEVILAAWQAWGPDCVRRFNGMWSFVIADLGQRRLFLSRDRLGVKPMYYHRSGNALIIASEIKQIRALLPGTLKPNLKVCVSYLATGYEQPPETFFNGIQAFPPASSAWIDLDSPDVRPERFWFPETIEPTPGLEDCDAVESIRHAFDQAVRFRLRSDVPVGGCLSGGLDSSSIFVAMKEISPSSTFTAFSACFDDPEIDERPFMRSVVERTASRHIEIFPDNHSLTVDLNRFLELHDEPVGSLSIYAQYKVMEKARAERIPVLLDGQGGDELFSGYWPAYLLMLDHKWKTRRPVRIIRDLLGALTPWGNPELVRNILALTGEYRKRASGQLPFQIRKSLIREFDLPRWHLEARQAGPEAYRRAELFRIHLPRLLKWEDRNSMAHAIESRVPFLDVNLVEAVLRIRPERNLRIGWNKYLFRKAMEGRLPDKICWRKDKMGFETPQSRWMKSGSFHDRLLDWSQTSDPPVSQFLESGFGEIRPLLVSGAFDPTALFRLFCLDRWLIAGN
jgi:asparagine synthase (glutamine-hydrolysing)